MRVRPGISVFLIGFIFFVLVSVSLLLPGTRRYPFSQEHDLVVRSTYKTIIGISISQLVVLIANMVYLLWSWPPYNRANVRSCTVLAFIPSNVSLDFILASLLHDVSKETIDTGKLGALPSGITDDQVRTQSQNWTAIMRLRGTGTVIGSVLLAIVHLGATAFSFWLLPSRHRLPKQYEPVVAWRRWSLEVRSIPEPIELIVRPISGPKGHLEAIFREHESMRVQVLTPLHHTALAVSDTDLYMIDEDRTSAANKNAVY